MSPFELFAGLWLAMWPAVGGNSVPLAPLSVSPEIRLMPAVPDTPSSLLVMDNDVLLARIQEDPTSLGSLSIGRPGNAKLFNGVQLPADPLWQIAPSSDSWGTVETIDAIRTVITTVCDLFPDTPRLVIGDISDREGGRLKRHQSHQGGQDVDFGYYYKDGKAPLFAIGTAANLDLPRNWALLRAMLTRTDIETILLDTRIQRTIYQYALSIGEDKGWLDQVFQFARNAKNALIVYYPGHRTHYHVRFINPVAQELGRRAQPLLIQAGLMKPPVYTVWHKVKAGETLGVIAAKYGTSSKAIMQSNGLRTAQLIAGRSLRIGLRGGAPATDPIVVPHRLLPPSTPEALSAVEWPTPESLYGSDGEQR